MEVLTNLALALSGLFSVSCIFRVISAAVSYNLACEDEKPQYKRRVRNTLLVFFISVIVGAGGGAVKALVLYYYG